MFLPVRYSMTSSQGISMLMALYIGGISGGLISAILLNIPGTLSSVATCFDGKPMADKGEAGKALGTGVVFSFIGTIIGLILLIVLSPVLCNFALKFQAYEYCALAIFSLSMVIALTGHDMPKGLISAVLGALLATVGLAPIDSKPRFTFGLYQLNNGFALVVLLIGLFAISEIMADVGNSSVTVRSSSRSGCRPRVSRKRYSGFGGNSLAQSGAVISSLCCTT